MARYVWTLIFLLRVVGAHINVNVKSAALSRALRGEPGKHDKANAKETKPSLNHVALDLSGKFRCHVTAPHKESNEIDDGETPLFRFGPRNRSGWKPPSFLVGANYDFDSVWYGVNRLLATFRWKKVHEHDDSASATDVPEGASEYLLSPTTTTFCCEKGLLHPNDYALDLGLKWESREPWSLPMSLTARMDTKQPNSLLLMTPIHKRLNVVLKSSFVSTTPPKDYAINSRIPPWVPGIDPWIPQLTLGPTGALFSKIAVGMNPAWTRNRNVGLRVSVKRQLDWSIVGYTTEHDETETLLRVELCSSRGSCHTAIKCEALMEHVIDTACFTLSREQTYNMTQ